MLLGGAMAASAWGQGPPEANKAFEQYVARVEAEVLPRGTAKAIALGSAPGAGEVAVENLTPGDGEVAGGMLHHWRGTAFAPGARAADFERVIRDIGRYPEIYAPQVVSARVLGGAGDRRRMTMRVKQKHVITVVLETDYDVTSGKSGPGVGWSASRSTAVREIADADTPREHALGHGEDHGFLWRLNSYWTYEERNGGLLLRLESVSLTRRVPAGLGWAVKPFIESVPKESLEFTLSKTVDAVEKQRRLRG